MGQIRQSPKLPGAQINYLLSPEGSDKGDLILLLEGLIKEAGQWGAKQVLAEISPDSDGFSQFRRAGFSVLAKQRLFKFVGTGEIQTNLEDYWRIWTSDDIYAMRCLYMALVPPLIQPVEPLTRLEMLGLVYYDRSGELQAFADLVCGPVGVWVMPFVHPQSGVDISELMVQMIADLPDLNGRPVYVAVRSYQPWIESALESLSEERSLEQVLMVKHLAIRQRVSVSMAFKALENGNTEPTFPVTPIKNNGS